MVVEAGKLKVGSEIAEDDGFLWEVTEVVEGSDNTVTVRLNSDYSSLREHWKGEKGILKTFDKSTEIQALM